ncbi:MAG: response regulator transcription factor [Planctomycetes bacterium]|nr:response regulator transcription factor [Planctomycetota bacterium]
MQTTDTVFIVDDSMDIRQSFTAMVSNRGLRAESFSSGAEFLGAYNDARFGQTTGCLIVDVRLPGMSGLDVLEALGERGIRLPAIVVTGYGEIPMVVRAIRAGAIDFLEKPCDSVQLNRSIDLAFRLDALNRKVVQQLSAIDGRLALLTPPERRVMELLVAGRPNKAIAAELDLSLRTIEFRRARVLQVLDVRSVSEVVAVKVARDRLVVQSTRPFNEWTDGLGVGSPADCDFDLCPAWIQESPAAAFPDVAPTVESSLALGAP